MKNDFFLFQGSKILFHLTVSHFNLLIQRIVVGDASETALLKFTELTVGNIMEYRNRFRKVVEVPFNSTNKFQVRAGALFPLSTATRTLQYCHVLFYGSLGQIKSGS